ncbi:hypothetical protein ACIBG0_35480 [Nocardia sp. NPDC050630]|uniref:hypothetical protein n=1 Tax=Nocardia sp. NPDC050630 TaxID=3364321 RepID=UPI0037A2363D
MSTEVDRHGSQGDPARQHGESDSEIGRGLHQPTNALHQDHAVSVPLQAVDKQVTDSARRSSNLAAVTAAPRHRG